VTHIPSRIISAIFSFVIEYYANKYDQYDEALRRNLQREKKDEEEKAEIVEAKVVDGMKRVM
jgi:hypothetical protein